MTAQESPPPGICIQGKKNAKARGSARAGRGGGGGGAGRRWNRLMHNADYFIVIVMINYIIMLTPRIKLR